MFKKSTDGLKWASSIAVVGSSVFFVSIIVGFFMKRNEIDYSQIGWIWTKNTGMQGFIDLVSHLPTIVMAFTFQFNFFSFYKSLDKADDKLMLKVTFRSLVSVCAIYLVVAILGYIMFGPEVKPKIIDNFNSEKDFFGKFMLSCINFSFMLVSGMSFPLLFFNCRNFVVSVIIDIQHMCSKKKSMVSQEEHDRNSRAIEDCPMNAYSGSGDKHDKRNFEIMFRVVSGVL